jgi:hypothetical protein
MRSDILLAVNRGLFDVRVTATFHTIDHAFFLSKLTRHCRATLAALEWLGSPYPDSNNSCV